MLKTTWTLFSITKIFCTALAWPGSFANTQYLPTLQPTQLPPPIITKQFFTVSAPEDQYEYTPRHKHLIIGRPTRNYRVIFIKTPNDDANNLRYTAELATQEERTVIYVLTRKQKELEANDIATTTTPQNGQQLQKPEVYFIKYKTNEEADNAQKQIQSQYDELGGTSEYTDAGIAPVQSVVGALNAITSSKGYLYAKRAAATLQNAQELNQALLPTPITH